MERIVFLDRDSIRADFRVPDFPHEWIDYPMTNASETLERLRGATMAVTNKVALRAKDLEQLPKLRMIAVAATGTDCVDTEYCREKGIEVANVRNYAVHSVPEHVFALILALRRNLVAYREAVLSGKWQKSKVFCLLDYPIFDLHASTLGIVGYGSLGRSVEKIARAFGMKILIAEHKNAPEIRDGRSSFDEVLANSDIVTLHCPLTAETREFIGSVELGKMKHGALLINCGRGGLVDENALLKALQNGTIAGAGVDVLSGEPPINSNPLIADLPNLLLTPHIAWASSEAMQSLADTLIDNLETFIKN